MGAQVRLGLLSRCAYETVRRCFRARLGGAEGLPGMVAAIQTFGNQLRWNPQIHSLVTDGLLLPGGGFHPMRLWDEDFERLLTETYRRLVLDAPVAENRLTEDNRERFLTYRHGGGFSVYGHHLILNEEPARLAHRARYAMRPPVALDRVHRMEDGRVLLTIDPDPGTKATTLRLDPMEWLRRVTNQFVTGLRPTHVG